MKKTRNFLKNNTKMLIALIVGIIISGISVYAATNYFYNSNEISFNNTKSNLKIVGTNNDVTNVKEALDSLYDKVTYTSGCPSSYTKGYSGLIEYHMNILLMHCHLWYIHLHNQVEEQNLLLYLKHLLHLVHYQQNYH